jgi:hypothetical protein
MLFFRSEAHIDKWYAGKDLIRGETFSRGQLWSLANRWYGDRLDVDFDGRTLAEVQQIFQEVGLTSSFWKAADY